MDINSLMAEFNRKKNTPQGKRDIDEMLSTPWKAEDLVKLAKANGLDVTSDQANAFLAQLKKG